MFQYDDTIYALSSGALPSGVAIVRVSGTQAFAACLTLAGTIPAYRQATLRTIRTRNNLYLDQALILAFQAPHSFTGEDCVEFHIHGGRAVAHALLEELSVQPGLRPAEAGEFSRRAFENGKLDLVEVEGLADLISAETEMQRRLAIEQSSGGLSRLYNGWADRLTGARALIEAELDFADEDDVPGSVSDRVWSDMLTLVDEINHHLADASVGEIIRDGFRIVIAGPPNVGKSSLMNALAKRDVAIVTDIAGTTRDLLHVDLDMDGFMIRLYDTAGLRTTSEIVEKEGIRRARMAIDQADLVLQLEEIGLPIFTGDELDFTGRIVRVGTKSDLYPGDGDRYDICISVLTGQGLSELRDLIVRDLQSRLSGQSMAIPSRIRHVAHLKGTMDYLNRALSTAADGLDIRAENLRIAADNLGKITGRVDVENLLDIIFSEFCIGK